MNGIFMTLLAIAFVTILAGLILSLRIRSRQKGEIDHGVNQKIKENPIMLNPIIWSYVLFAALIIMLLWFFKQYYQVPF
ncbi:hypothetical protein [Ammoniphilus sp. YIM 78166]|uniref:hypothetical protein n=1 Tax=Ammoniphilus sp. YIM 78166 TaxID=1644106 RepID=UPI00106F2F91|nr:hypothetical protein [Ammoniphilus sp. YIM 78166]